MVIRLSALLAGRRLPQEDSWYSFLLEAIVRLEGLGQLKNPSTSSGIETATFRLVAQRHLVHDNDISLTEPYVQVLIQPSYCTANHVIFYLRYGITAA
jgi:hypothetical protein